MNRRYLQILILLFSLSLTNITAQVVQTGIVDGIVTDKDGNPVGGVFITIESKGIKAQKVSTISDFEGLFRVPGLPPGHYSIEAHLEGYVQTSTRRFNLRVNQVLRLVIKMEEGFTERPEQTHKTTIQNSLYARPFSEEAIAEQLGSQFPVRLFWLEPEWTMSDLRASSAGIGFGGRTDHTLELVYDNLRLNSPIDGSYLINPGFIPGATISLQEHFESPRRAATSGSISFNANERIENFHGALSLKGGVELFSSSDDSYDNLSNRFIKGGTILSRSFYEHSSWLILTALAGKSETNQLIRPVVDNTNDNLFLEMQWINQFSNNSELVFRGLYLLDDINNYNAVSSEEWQFENINSTDSTDSLEKRTALLGARYTQRLSENILISYDADYASLSSVSSPNEENRDIPTRRDSLNRVLYQGSLSGTWFDHSTDRITAAADLEFFLDEITGTHQIHLGLEAEYSESNRMWGYNGEQLIELRDGLEISTAYYANRNGISSPVESNSVLTRFSLHAQDDWLLNPNLLINIGIRFDGTDIENSTTRVVEWNSISPRIGINYDLFNDGSVILRAGIARYYDQARINWSMSDPYRIVRLLREDNISQLSYAVVRSDHDYDTNERYGYDGAWSPGNTDTDPPETDEIFAIVELSPWQNWMISSSVLYRKTNDILEDMDLVINSDRQLVIGEFSGFAAAGATSLSGQDYQYFYRLPDSGGRYSLDYYWGNDSRLSRKLSSFRLDLHGKLNSNLSLQARYIWSSIRGTIDITGVDVTSHSDSQNTPSAFLNAEGYLSSDIRHQFKILGVYSNDIGFSASLLFNYASGMPYNRYALNPDPLLLDYQIRLDPRGEHYRYDDQYRLDLRLEQTLLFKEHRFTLAADIYNLLDNRAVVDVDQRDTAQFGNTLAVSLPRTISATVKYQF